MTILFFELWFVEGYLGFDGNCGFGTAPSRIRLSKPINFYGSVFLLVEIMIHLINIQQNEI